MTQKIIKNLPLHASLIALAATGAISNPVAAQSTSSSADVSALEEIVVTGTRRKDRTLADSPVPVDVIGGGDLSNSGLTETNMLLSNLLPSFNFPQPSITDGTDHVRPAQLRGLAPDHTLVLVNGKRRHASAMLNLNGSAGRGSSAVDLNMIPANAIKRIEVLRDGAAAQYGSDAIAGVINVVLKDDAEGGQMSATWGQHRTTMDGVPDLDNVGIDGDGNLTFTTGADRKRRDGETLTLRGDIGMPIGDAGSFHVAVEYRDRNPTNRSDYDSREAYARIDGELDPRELTYDRYNTRFGNSRVEDFSIFYNAVVPTGEMELYSFGSFGRRKGESGGFNRLPGNSRNVPEIYPDGFLPFITSDIDDYSFAAGLRGQVSGWDFDLSAVYGLDDFNFGVSNSLNTSLGADSPTEFDAGTLKNDQLTFNLDLSKLIDMGGLPNPVNVAFGLEYRDEGYEIIAGEEASYIDGGEGGAAGSQVFPGFAPSSEIDDGRHSFGAYLELDTDLTDRWNIAVAGRFEDYSDFGSTVNGKVATRFALTDSLALRGSVSTGFRAPSLAQQYFTSIATVFVDGEPTETGTFPPSSDVALALGSPGLDSESATNFGVGLTWAAENGLSLTVDYYNIKINDRIVLSSNLSGDGVESLLAGTGANRARFFLNGIDTRTQGIDVVLTYTADLGNAGELRLNAGYNYNKTEVTDIIDPPSELASVGVEQDNLFDFNEFTRFERGSPRTKLNLSGTWMMEKWQVVARTTRYGETWDPSSNADRNEIIPSAWVTDLDVTYTISEQLALTLGANNIFDVYPEATRNLVNDVTTFSRIFPYSGFSPFGFNGRYVYGKVTVNF